LLVRLFPFVFLLALGLLPVSLCAQQRPLSTEDPEPIGAGRIAAAAGVSAGTDIVFPLSGLRGTLYNLPLASVTFGLGPSADLQISGGPYDRLEISSRSTAPLSPLVHSTGLSTSDVHDIVLGTRVRWIDDVGGVAVGSLFAVRLPNAKHPSGLGQDTTDFSALLLLGKTVAGVRAAGNIGVTIMAEPLNASKQNDVLTYGVSLTGGSGRAFAPLAEINGRKSTRKGTAPIGTESRSIARVGARFTRGRATLDIAAGRGFNTIGPTMIFDVGLTRVFGE
jgi:hypothetical protein